jgi:RHH-type rel operon transcriptional repressor/antitoxin RelB
MLALRLSPELEARLNRLAKRTGRTKSFYAREAIVEHLTELEMAYDALQVMKKPGKIYSAKEAKRALGL